MLGKVKRPYRKRLAPVSRFPLAYACHYPEAIPYEGQVVTVTQHYGPFRFVVASNGKGFVVGQAMLVPVNQF